MMKPLLTVILLAALAAPAQADEPTFIAAMNAQAQGTLQHAKDERAAEIKRRRKINLISALAFCAEGIKDADQSRKIISHGGRENNPLTPPIVVRDFRRNSGIRAKIGFCTAAGAGYALGNRLDPTPGVVVDAVEFVNILSNAGQTVK